MTSKEIQTRTAQAITHVKAFIGPFLQIPNWLEEIEAREAAVAERETCCARLDSEISERQSHLKDLDASIRQAEQKQAGLRATIEKETARERERMFSALDVEAAPLREQLEAVRQELAEKQAVLAQLRA